MHQEYKYLDLLQHILDNGTEKGDRTGTGTISTFGYQMRFDLSKEFPLLTTKKMFTKGIIHELLWFLSGDTNIKYLQDNGVHIWDSWSGDDGDLGKIYSHQWRRWNCDFDQISYVIEQIKSNPNGRRHLVTAWNPSDLKEQALPACHCLFQFYVANGKLSCQLYQRSADVFLGVPFNIASYALLTQMVAHVCDLEIGEFVHTFGDVHIYKNHLEQVKTQLKREPKKWPTMKIKRKVDSIFDFKYEDFELQNYECHPAIKGKVSV